MDKIATLRALLSSIEVQMLHHECHERIAFVPIHGATEPVAIFEHGRFVGWVRLSGNSAVWRYGTMGDGLVAPPRVLGNPWSEEGRGAIAQAVNDAWDEIEPAQSPAASVSGEPELFIASVEAGEMTVQAPATAAAVPRGAAQTAATSGTQETAASGGSDPAEESPYATYFNAAVHDKTRYPAAPGYSEKQLDGRVLETIHPAAWPASIGAIMMFMAVLPMPYEFYVLLRWVVPAMAIWVCTVASGQKKTGWVVVFVIVAILWNPILPIEMPRSAWALFNAAGLALFATAGAQLKASKPALRTDSTTSL